MTSSTGKVCVLDGTCPSPEACQSESSAGASSVSCTDVSGHPFDFTPPYVSNTCLPSRTFPAALFQSYNQDSTCTFTGCGTTGYGIVGNIGSQQCQWVKNITSTWASTISNVTVETKDTVEYSAFDGAPVGCLECPDNAFNSTTTPCRCKMGFWSEQDRLSSTQQFCIPCPYQARCLGGNTCAGKFGGMACASCQPGYYTLASSCFICPETAGLEYVAVAVVGSAAVYWTFQL